MFPPIIKRNTPTALSQFQQRTNNLRGPPILKRCLSSKGKLHVNINDLRSKSNNSAKVAKQIQFDESTSSGKLSVLPISALRRILQFSLYSYDDLLVLQCICRRFFHLIRSEAEVYRYLQPNMVGCPCIEIREVLKDLFMETILTRNQGFVNKIDQLFLYGATKLNIPDKLIDSCKLSAKVQVNSNCYPARLLTRKANFATHLYIKVPLDQIYCPMKEGTTQALKLNICNKDNIIYNLIEIYCNLLKITLAFTKLYTVKQILENCIRQKAFNYFVDGGMLITYFEGDDKLLYMVFEISAVQVIYLLSKKIKSTQIWKNRVNFKEKSSKAKLMVKAQRAQQIQIEQARKLEQQEQNDEEEDYITFQQQQQHLKKPSAAKPPKPNNPGRQTFARGVQIPTPKIVSNRYSSIAEYFADQQDFEVIVNIHNGQKGQNLMAFIDTKALPKCLGNQLSFQYLLNETVNTNIQFFLDNKLGMKELVKDLYLGDVVIKDRDRFLVLYSGFVKSEQQKPTELISLYQLSTLEYSSEEVFQLSLNQSFRFNGSNFRQFKIKNLMFHQSMFKKARMKEQRNFY